MKDTIRIIAASAFVTALLIKAVPAIAEPVAQNVTIVRTADLNLTSAADQRELDRRISLAAIEVCGTASDVDLAGKNDARQCRQAVVAEARAKSAAMVADRAGDRSILIAAR